MSTSEKIAIVGIGGIFPGSNSLDGFWNNLVSGKDCSEEIPKDRWPLDPQRFYSDIPGTLDKTPNLRGYFIKDMPSNYGGLDIDRSKIEKLDDLFKLTLQAGRDAFYDAQHEQIDRSRTKVIIGNIALPTTHSAKMARELIGAAYAKQIADIDIEKLDIEAADHYVCGLPASLLAKGLGLGQGSFTLDAACASTLYALHLAVRDLISHEVDCVLSGGVSRPDCMYTQMGFGQLRAVSPTGQCNPFDPRGRGLMVGEGGGFFTLKRLSDALKHEDHIYGLICGTGLSNDQFGSLLAPDSKGQVRALKAAYKSAGWTPDMVDTVECHATGTPLGDRIELQTLKSVFGEQSSREIVIGSVKANVGHMLTGAGASGLMKVLLSMKHKRFAPTANYLTPIEGMEGSQFKVLEQSKEWEERIEGEPRRAGLSGFGFGGINAHVLIEEYKENSSPTVAYIPQKRKVAIVGTAQNLGVENTEPNWWGFENTKLYQNFFASNFPKLKQIAEIEVPLGKFKIPPVELKCMSPQQVLMLMTAEQALTDAFGKVEATDDAGVFIGLGLESSVNLLACSWQFEKIIEDWCQRSDLQLSEIEVAEWVEKLKASFNRQLTPDVTMGNLGGIVASRIAREFGFGGPSYALSNEENSGTNALKLAFKAIERGELNSALVGAVDFNCELQSAIAGYLMRHNAREAQPESIQDGAVALVLKEYDLAIADGNKILAVINNPEEVSENLVNIEWNFEEPASQSDTYRGAFGSLSAVRETALGLREKVRPYKHEYWFRNRSAGPRTAIIKDYTNDHGFGLEGSHIYLQESPCSEERPMMPKVQVSGFGNYEPKDLGPNPKIAFLYPGAGNCYPKMGKQLASAFPDVMELQDKQHLNLKDQFAVETFWKEDLDRQPTFLDVLAGQCSVGCFVTELLNEFSIKPDALIGYSLGESAGAFATGIWRGRDALYKKLDNSPLFKSEIHGPMNSVKRLWNLDENETVDWVTCLVLKSPEVVAKAAKDLDRVYVGNINTDNEVVVSGDRAQVIEMLDIVDYPLIEITNLPAVHSPAVGEPRTKEMYNDFHRVPTQRIEGLSVYSGASGEKVEPTTEGIANSILNHGINGVNFPKVIRSAYEDGVRIFIEIGPGSSLTRMVKDILRDKEFEAVAICDKATNELSNLKHCLSMLSSYGKNVHYKKNIHRVGATASAKDGQNLKSIKIGVGGSNDLNVGSKMYRFISAEASIDSRSSEVGNSSLGASQQPHQEFYATNFTNEMLPSYAAKQYYGMTAEKNNTSFQTNYTQGAPVATDPKLTTELISTLQQGGYQMGNTSSSMATDPTMLQAIMTTQVHSNEAQIAHMKLNNSYMHSMQELFSNFYSSTNEQFLQSQSFEAPTEPDFYNNQQTPAGYSLYADQIPVPNDSNGIPHGIDLNRDAAAWIGFEKCMEYANGLVGNVLGPDFAEADNYPTRVRLPDGPLMLCHRIMNVTGDPKSMTNGTLETEHDVINGAWYLDDGYIPTCIAVEAGQADLFLSGWLGADFHTKGNACYRLLDATVKFHNDLPAVGSTINYQIYIKEFFYQGETLLFRFGFEATANGQKFITMENGCAGFFTEEELALGKGIVKTAIDLKPVPGTYTGNFAAITSMKVESFDEKQIDALRVGDYAACFGQQFSGLELKNPKLLPGAKEAKMNLVDRILNLDPNGGRYGIGIITGEADIQPDDWFLTCHFIDDQVMPGTLMFECCQHTLRVFMMRMGWVGETEEIRCQPKPGVASRLKCRGQVRSNAKKVQYQIEIKEIGYGDDAYCIADALMFVDGRPIVEIGDMSLELKGLTKSRVEDIWSTRLGLPYTQVKPAIYTYEQICAFSNGKPSDAFGEPYKIFDGEDRKIARLPRDPYQFLDRITDVRAEPWVMQKGGVIEAQYDVPADAWYFKDAGSNGEMPFAVLLEAALQPCGWFSAYMGSALAVEEDVKYRNLGGKAKMLLAVTPDTGVLTTKVTCTGVSQSAGMILQTFDFSLSCKDGVVYEGNTMFGFFTKAALSNQQGIKDTDVPKQVELARQNKAFDIKGSYPVKDCLPCGNMVMLDAITDEENIIIGQKAVNREEWFFDAHFFEDPVMPGSLGLEAVLQLCFAEAARQFGTDDGHITLAKDGEHEWVYRGQVVPKNSQIQTVAEIVEVDHERKRLKANGFLLVDGLLVYRMHNFIIEVK